MNKVPQEESIKSHLTPTQTFFALGLAATVAAIVTKKLIEHGKKPESAHIEGMAKGIASKIVREEDLSDSVIHALQHQPENIWKKRRLIERILRYFDAPKQ